MSSFQRTRVSIDLLRGKYSFGVAPRKNRVIRTINKLQSRNFSAKPSIFKQLESKRIIITGGAQGIGESVVHAYAAEGAIVTSMDMNDTLGAKVASDYSSTGPGSVSYVSVDVASKKSVISAFTEASQKMGGLDVLVHVAGIQKHAPAHDPPEDFLERITKINIGGTLFTNAAAYQLMKEGGKGGAIINFGSSAGLTAETGNSLYGLTKGAVHTWTRSVAREWGADGVRINAVLPYVATPMYHGFLDGLSLEELEAHKKGLVAQFPLGGNLGDVAKDLAPIMVFLASDASHWMTGQLFPVDGGYITVR